MTTATLPPLVGSDFEDGTGQGWGPRIGAEQVAVTDTDAHSGTRSLLVTARTLTSATRRVPGGYRVEAAIACNDVCPRAGALTGFELQVTDAGAGRRTDVTTWNDPTGRTFVDTSRWGVVRFGRP